MCIYVIFSVIFLKETWKVITVNSFLSVSGHCYSMLYVCVWAANLKAG